MLHKGQKSWFNFKESPSHHCDLLDLVSDGGGRCLSGVWAEVVELFFLLPFDLDQWHFCGMKRRVEDVVEASMLAVIQSQINRRLSGCLRFAICLLIATSLEG